MSRAFPIAGLLLSLMLQPGRAAEPAPIPSDLVERVMSTVAFRFEQAEKLAELGRTAEAEAAYQELIDLHELADPLAAQTWLNLAALRAGRGNTSGAWALYLEVQDRFRHIPWATTEAEAALDRLATAGEGTAPSRDPFQAEKPASAAIVSGDRLISIDFKEADLANVTAMFSKVLEVPLYMDPALGERRVTIHLREAPLRDAIGQVAEQTDTRVVKTHKGYRLVAKSSRAEAGPQPTAGVLKVEGGLDRQAIEKVVRARWHRLAWCFRDQVAPEGDPIVRLKLAWNIVPSGRVDFVHVVPQGTTALAEPARKCVEDIIKTWRFPRFESGTVSAMHDIQFRLGQQ